MRRYAAAPPCRQVPSGQTMTMDVPSKPFSTIYILCFLLSYNYYGHYGQILITYQNVFRTPNQMRRLSLLLSSAWDNNDPDYSSHTDHEGAVKQLKQFVSELRTQISRDPMT